ncbi:hypothetical protein [Kribbella antibiotica]|uniref:hypothetical protein n=1 Tax=Kribbella antibiotica TaxID=190195 RepID=UPI00192DCFE3|nr:hypothetical protein [Kribbella antibiotica]
MIGTAGAANQEYLRSLGAVATTYGEGWVDRVRRLGQVDAALDLAGSGVIRELVELTGDPRKALSIADLGAPELGVRFSGVAGSVPEALAGGTRRQPSRPYPRAPGRGRPSRSLEGVD